MRSWALRMNTSVPTLSAMEKGNPRVSMGVYATALWLVGRDEALRDLVALENDPRTLAQDPPAIPPEFLRTTARADRYEAALFAFLAEQARAPDEGRLLSSDLDAAARENLGFLVLLLAITVERYVPLETITKLNNVSAQLLGPRLNNADYGRWLRSGHVNVGRLNSYLEQTFSNSR